MSVRTFKTPGTESGSTTPTLTTVTPRKTKFSMAKQSQTERSVGTLSTNQAKLIQHLRKRTKPIPIPKRAPLRYIPVEREEEVNQPLLSHHKKATQSAAFWCCNAPDADHGGEPKLTVLVKGEVGHCFKNVMKQKDKPYTSILDVEGEDELYSVWVVDRERKQVTHHITTYSERFWPAENKAHLITCYNREELLLCRGEPQTKGGDKARRPKKKATTKKKPHYKREKETRKPRQAYEQKSRPATRPGGHKKTYKQKSIAPMPTMLATPMLGTSAAPVAWSAGIKQTHPVVVQTADGLRIKHTEYIEAVSSTSSASTYHVFRLGAGASVEGFNPGCGMFTWLRQIAKEYEMYKWHKMVAVWVPENSTSDAVDIVGAFVRNPNDPPPQDLSHMMKLEGAKLQSVWAQEDRKWNLYPGAMNRMVGWRYVRNASKAADLKWYDYCNFYYTLSGAADSTTYGHWLLEYEVEFTLASQKEQASTAANILVAEPNQTGGLTNGVEETMVLGTVVTQPDGASVASDGKSVTIGEGNWEVNLVNFSGDENGTKLDVNQLRDRLYVDGVMCEAAYRDYMSTGESATITPNQLKCLVSVQKDSKKVLSWLSTNTWKAGTAAVNWFTGNGGSKMIVKQVLEGAGSTDELLQMQRPDGTIYYRPPGVYRQKMQAGEKQDPVTRWTVEKKEDSTEAKYPPMPDDFFQVDPQLTLLEAQATGLEAELQDGPDSGRVEELQAKIAAIKERIEQHKVTKGHRECDAGEASEKKWTTIQFDEVTVDGKDILIRFSDPFKSKCVPAILEQLRGEGYKVGTIYDVQPHHGVWYVLKRMKGSTCAYEGHVTRKPALVTETYAGFKPRLLTPDATPVLIVEYGFPQSDTKGQENFSC